MANVQYEEPGKEGLYDPPVPGRLKESCADPPTEDEESGCTEDEWPELGILRFTVGCWAHDPTIPCASSSGGGSGLPRRPQCLLRAWPHGRRGETLFR